LPKDAQERFHYDLEKATSYSSEQAANYAAYQKQQEETRRQRADADTKNRAILAEQQPLQIARRPSEPVSMSFRNRKTICFSRLVGRSNPDPRTMVVRTTRLCSTTRIRKSLNYRFFRAISAIFVTKKARFGSNWRRRSVKYESGARQLAHFQNFMNLDWHPVFFARIAFGVRCILASL